MTVNTYPMTVEDWAEFKGYSVNVEPKKDDLFDTFTGKVKGISVDLVLVEDQDGEVWGCTCDQISWNTDEYMH